MLIAYTLFAVTVMLIVCILFAVTVISGYIFACILINTFLQINKLLTDEWIKML